MLRGGPASQRSVGRSVEEVGLCFRHLLEVTGNLGIATAAMVSSVVNKRRLGSGLRGPLLSFLPSII